jgi:MATE family multidrug resistance protein
MIPIMVGWWYTEDILEALWIERFIAEYSGNYLIHVLPGLWFFLSFDCLRRFLQCQRFFWPCMVVNAISTILHVFWCWLFIIHYDMLEIGAGIATSITYITNFVLVFLIIWIGKLGYESWTACDFGQTFWPDIWKYLVYSVPSAAMQVIDSINFEIT